MAAAGTDPRPDEDRIGLARITQDSDDPDGSIAALFDSESERETTKRPAASETDTGGAAAEAGGGKRRKVASGHGSPVSDDRIKTVYARLNVEHHDAIRRQPGYNLRQQIDRALQEGDIDHATHAAAHEARLAGNSAVHAAPGAFGTQLLDDGNDDGGDVIVPQSERTKTI